MYWMLAKNSRRTERETHTRTDGKYWKVQALITLGFLHAARISFRSRCRWNWNRHQHKHAEIENNKKSSAVCALCTFYRATSHRLMFFVPPSPPPSRKQIFACCLLHFFHSSNSCFYLSYRFVRLHTRRRSFSLFLFNIYFLLPLAIVAEKVESI